MQPRAKNPSPSIKAIQLLCALGLALASSVSAFANQTGQVVIRSEVGGQHRTALLESLGVITGLDLSFNRDGVLILGYMKASGSASARDLLMRAVQGNNLIVVEEASNRADVAFCRLILRSMDRSHRPIYVVQIDFEDFQYVFGDKNARASFNVGWGLLHEVDHVVSGSEDTTFPSATGECEENINKMRLELGLPIRATYRFTRLPAPADPAFITRLVRLGFVKTDSQRNVRKRYWLVWDASLVGGTDSRSEIAISTLSR